MSNAYRLILIAGDKHSKVNAERIREWSKECGLSTESLTALALDWYRRGYLTAEDLSTLWPK